MKDFKQCTISACDDGIFSIDCKLGLWGVSGNDKEKVQAEALRYFMQYKDDGEYHQITGGESPADKLIKVS